MSPVEDFILDYPHENTKQLMQLTHQLLLDSIPQLQYDIKWKVPYYTYKKGFCFFNPKPKHLILGLMNGPEFADPNGLLVGEQKLLRHYLIHSVEDVFSEPFMELLMEAVVLKRKEMKQEEEKEEFINPIDEDKVAENPHLLPYAHTVGGAVIRPIDKGKVKGLAVSAMYEQTEMQMDQIRKQVELLVQQAEEIRQRVEVSEKIYLAEMNIKPLIGHIYHLYEKKDGKNVLSMIGPNEWGKSCPYTFEATVKMLSDHTWEIQS